MKKFLPAILFLIGALVLVGVYFLVIKGKGDESGLDDESALIEVPLNERPVASLTPSTDGHWLKMRIEKIVIDAESLDYELLYKLPDGRTQGVPGTVALDNKDVIENDLLLGSESSGKFRYDEGVEQGTLTLRFRNEKGKLIAKFSTDFHLSTGDLTSVDGKFAYIIDTPPPIQLDYYVVMETFGVPKETGGSVAWGPFGIFSSLEKGISGTVEFDMDVGMLRYDGKEWVDVQNNQSAGFGIFVGVSE